ncbi:hypothetical protein D9M73_114450 [compost metagenome]
MGQPLGMHTLTKAEAVEQVGRGAFEHAGADASQDIVGRCPLHDHSVYALRAKQVTEQKSGGAGSNNRDLCPCLHALLSLWRSDETT